MVERVILHVDMDAFYAAIEQRENPEWCGKPVVVGSGPHERGVVSTCSYEAREFGIRSAMPSREAYRRCPQAIFTRPRMWLYEKVSAQVYDILGRYTPLVEPLSIDEAFLDISGSLKLFGAPAEVAGRIRADLRRELRLSGSIGIAHNMFLAKFASDMNKPDGQTEVPRDAGAVRDFLAPHPLRRLWGVGVVTAERLRKAGLRTIGDLQACPLSRLVPLLGSSAAGHLHRLSFGMDERELCTDWVEKSVSREHTFKEDTADRAVLLDVLYELAEDVGRQVRANGRLATVARLKLRWSDFRTITRQSPFEVPSRDDFTFRETARVLFDGAFTGRSVRLIGFGASGFTEEREHQAMLFDDPSPLREKRESLCDAMDDLRRLGVGSVGLGREPRGGD